MDEFRPKRENYGEGVRFGEYKVTFETGPGAGNNYPAAVDEPAVFFDDRGPENALMIYSDQELPAGWRQHIDQILVKLGGEDYLDNWIGTEEREVESYLLESKNAYSLPERSEPRRSGLRGRLADWVAPEPDTAETRFTVGIHADVDDGHEVPWANSIIELSPAAHLRHDEPYLVTAGTVESLMNVQVWHDTSIHPTEFVEYDDL